jgi:hypothetical protein
MQGTDQWSYWLLSSWPLGSWDSGGELCDVVMLGWSGRAGRGGEYIASEVGVGAN